MLRHLPRTRAVFADVPLIEAGFPSDEYHAVYSIPTMGFLGAAAWAHPLLDAFQQPRLGMGSARL